MDRVEQLETALEIDSAPDPRIRVDDTRRLTGPGLLWDLPGAVMDVFLDGIDPAPVSDLWHLHARRVLDALGWHDEQVTHRHFQGGANLAISAPMDQLYSAIFAAQTAWHFCAAELTGTPPGSFDAMIGDIRGVMAQEANPALIRLIGAAQTHGIDILCDDDEISLGHGTGSRVWPFDALPEPDRVDWAALHDIPVAFITGTNGKTTTTRLCTAIARAAGRVAGLTSTDMVRVGDDILDRGDYSGPGGARMLLRDRRVEIACLEVARGGILRRGLPTRRARVAVVTNVAADHLGQYGVNTVPELAQAKFAVHRTLGADGVLVLNADDAHVVDEAAHVDKTICWFALSPDNPHIRDARAAGRPCAWLEGETLTYSDGARADAIATVAEVPVTLNGSARYNVQNALAAICVGRALDLPDAAIRAGLAGFRPDARDNPGRCNEFAHNGARVFVDFAHNPHSIAAVCDALSGLKSGRRFILLSHAGDRSDGDIRDLTATALRFRPDVVVAAELAGYLRGREIGEVPDLIETAALERGLRRAQVLRADSPPEGARMILDRLRPGDLALLLVLAERDTVFGMLQQAADG